MTINTQALGSNSWYVAYTAGETVPAIKQSVEDVIVAHGWELHDENAPNSGRVYKAPLSQYPSKFKYVLLEYYSSGNPSLVIRVFENWNATSHVGTNEAYLYKGSTYRSLSMDTVNGGYLYIFANSRYLILLSRINSNGNWGYSASYVPSASSKPFAIGCVEFSLDNGEVAGTYPNFGYFTTFSGNGGSQVPASLSNMPVNVYNIVSMLTMKDAAGTANIGYRYLSLPRTTSGDTGDNAERVSNLQVMYSHPKICAISSTNNASYTSPQGQNAIVYTEFDNWQYGNGTNGMMMSQTIIDILPTGNNPSTSLPYCITPHVLEMDLTNCNALKTYRGRMFGIKIAGMGKDWAMLDTVNVKVDAEQFHSESGSVLAHYYLGNNFIIPA